MSLNKYLPLTWPISVHKSQGLTFEHVIADLGAAFAPGQVYVALSRCTSFQGLILKSPIGRDAIKTSAEVINFAHNETPETLVEEELSSGKADFYYKQARKAWKSKQYIPALDALQQAVLLRNELDSAIFKRYILVGLNKLLNHKQRAEKQQKEILSYQQKLEQAEESSSKLSEENKILSGSLNDKSQELTRNKEELVLLKEEIRALKEEKKSLISQQVELESKLEDQNSSLSSLQKKYEQEVIKKRQQRTKIESQISEKQQLETVIIEQKAEIERLKQLSWFDRLRGKR